MRDDADLIAAIEQHILPFSAKKFAVAVSGGGDSMALMCAASDVAQKHGIEVLAISVDHGLRPETAEEMQMVTDVCVDINIAHHIEYWSGWDRQGNLQDAARRARYQLISDWASVHGISTVLIGHTADDQAETLFMRLARGAGVDGLSAMPPRYIRENITFVRPFLSVRRDRLRTYLQSENIAWSDDPSNRDRKFERIKVRDVLAMLEPIGISVDKLAMVADNMRVARNALDWQTFLAAQSAVQFVCGAIKIDMVQFRAFPREIERRLIVRSLMWLSQSVYPARRASIDRIMRSLQDGKTVTLEGCQCEVRGNSMWIFREYQAVATISVEVGDLWDERWVLSGPEDDPEIEVRASGEEGLRQFPAWRDLNIPRAAAMGLPVVWDGENVIAAPLFEADKEWQVELNGGQDAFFAALLSQG